MESLFCLVSVCIPCASDSSSPIDSKERTAGSWHSIVAFGACCIDSGIGADSSSRHAVDPLLAALAAAVGNIVVAAVGDTVVVDVAELETLLLVVSAPLDEAPLLLVDGVALVVAVVDLELAVDWELALALVD